jgi:predicted nucleic acid-binding protein
MKQAVLDAYAILAWMQQEPCAPVVSNLFAQAEQEENIELFLSCINAGEVYYRLYKTAGSRAANDFKEALLQHKFPLILVTASNTRVWRASGLKGQYRISYADAFAIELAIDKGGQLVTGDPEILALAAQGVVDTCDLTSTGDQATE